MSHCTEIYFLAGCSWSKILRYMHKCCLLNSLYVSSIICIVPRNYNVHNNLDLKALCIHDKVEILGNPPRDGSIAWLIVWPGLSRALIPVAARLSFFGGRKQNLAFKPDLVCVTSLSFVICITYIYIYISLSKCYFCRFFFISAFSVRNLYFQACFNFDCNSGL